MRKFIEQLFDCTTEKVVVPNKAEFRKQFEAMMDRYVVEKSKPVEAV
jgi:hypothetical protein